MRWGVLLNPSSNLFLRAIRLIKPSDISYLKYSGRTTNLARQFVSSYEEPIVMKASVQAIDRAKYAAMGLDFSKNYIKVFIAQNTTVVGRDTSSDRFIYNGVTYQVDSHKPWFAVDGWASCLAIEVKDPS